MKAFNIVSMFLKFILLTLTLTVAYSASSPPQEYNPYIRGPKNPCGASGKYTDAMPACMTTCETYNQKNKCSKTNGQAGCICYNGSVYNEKAVECVQPKDCGGKGKKS